MPVMRIGSTVSKDHLIPFVMDMPAIKLHNIGVSRVCSFVYTLVLAFGKSDRVTVSQYLIFYVPVMMVSDEVPATSEVIPLIGEHNLINIVP